MSLPVDKVTRKAPSHIKVGELAETEALYKQVLSKFPKNKKAVNGIKALSNQAAVKAFQSQDPPQAKMRSVINFYDQGKLQNALNSAKNLLIQFPNFLG